MTLKLKTPVAGRYRFIVHKTDENGKIIPGTARIVRDWMPNLITNGGLDRMGDNADWLTWCQVGDGAATPAFTDTELDNRIAGSSTVASTVVEAQSTAPYYVRRTNTYRFTAGTATGEIAEVGVGWATSGSLFSRSLVVDGNGVPGTITVLSDETLDVVYEFRAYAPESDATGTVTLDSEDYDWTARASKANVQNSLNGWYIGQTGLSAGATGGGSPPRAWDGALGTVVQTPSGFSSNATSHTLLPYQTSSFERESTIIWNISSGNFAGGIDSMSFKIGWGYYQIGFSPAIPKTDQIQLAVNVVHSWVRRTL